MIGKLYIDDLDGAVTLFKSTEEGTETIAVFDEEHREVIQDLLAEVERLRKVAYRKDMQVGERDKEIKRLRERHVAFMQWMIENHDEIVNEWEASE